MENLIKKFNSQSKCDRFRKSMGRREWEIYWKDTGGTIIRESEHHDGIGNKETFATIQLLDWYGWNDGEISEHKYSFAVFLYIDEIDDGYNVFDTIEEAIEDYKLTCNKVKEILNSK